jgi:transposase-like protein
MLISKDKLIFLDTNILSDIGRFDEKTIYNLVYEISATLKSLIVVTTFNIIEIERIQDEEIKKRIYKFLDISNVFFLKGMDEIFAEEITSYISGKEVEPLKFICNILKKSTDGKPLNFSTVLNNFLSSEEFKQTLQEHNAINKKQQEHYQNKLNISEDNFVKILFAEHLKKALSNFSNSDLTNAAINCPAYIAFAYSLYSKIGSKGLKQKAGEMNDTAMSYLFPYCGVVVTERKHAALFNRLKDTGKIPALKDTTILKYSDVFVDSSFKLKEVLS